MIGRRDAVTRSRVVAVVATLPGGREQVGSGYLVRDRVVVTAEHCVRDKLTGRKAELLTLVRATDGLSTSRVQVAARAGDLDIAVLAVADPAWAGGLCPVRYARIDRDRPGELRDCVAIGYPLFQYEDDSRLRKTAELHGKIRQTDEAEVDRLLLRDADLTDVTVPEGVALAGELSPWGGLSGAVVFVHDNPVAVVVEHHPHQGKSSVLATPFDALIKRAATDPDAAAVARVLGLSGGTLPTVAEGDRAPALNDLVEIAVGDDLPALDSLNPYRLGTTGSYYGNEHTYGLRDPYLPRTYQDVEARLGRSLESGTLTVIVGPSKSGKSRTAFEAARRRWSRARVLVPLPGAWDELSHHPRLTSTDDAVLVWLDDIDRYLLGGDALTPARLDRVFARPGPTVAVGTMRSDRRDLLRGAAGELTRDARLLLESVATTIDMASTADDPAEQAASRALYPEEQFAGVGLGERLAHAPELLAIYHDRAEADVLQYLVVRTAVDWARIGINRPVPHPDLLRMSAESAFDERPDIDVDDAVLEAAISAARTPLPGRGRVAMLVTVALPGGIRGYRAFDYLVAADDGQTGPRRAVPGRFWEQALTRASADEAMAIADVAFRQNLTAPAMSAWQKAAAEKASTIAMTGIGLILAFESDPPDLEGGRVWLQRVVDAGRNAQAYEYAAAGLAIVIERLDPSDIDTARHWHTEAAEAGNTAAMSGLGILLSQRQDPPDLDAARYWFSKAAEADNITAMASLGYLLAEQQEPPDLEAARLWYTKAAERGSTDAMNGLAGVLLDRQPPDLDNARRWLTRGAEEGSVEAMVNLGRLLSELQDPPDVETARHWYERAAAAGSAFGMLGLGYLAMNEKPPDADAAERWFSMSMKGGNATARRNLGFLRLSVKDLSGAVETWTPLFSAGPGEDAGDAALNLAQVLTVMGETQEAQAKLRLATESGTTLAAEFAALIDGTGPEQETARRTLSQATEQNTDALNILGIAAFRAGDREEARRLWTRSAERHDYAAPLLLQFAGLADAGAGG